MQHAVDVYSSVWVCSALTFGLFAVSVFLGVCQVQLCARWAAVCPRETLLGTVYLVELGIETDHWRSSPEVFGISFLNMSVCFL